jgi:hypothetical protein
MNVIHRAMPIGFRKFFINVTGVVDCPKINIQKPIAPFEKVLHIGTTFKTVSYLSHSISLESYESFTLNEI